MAARFSAAMLWGFVWITPAVAAPPPNVVLIVVDTLRADHLSLYGYGRRTSPLLDRLGADAWVFERAFTVMSHTLPAHVSLMTGLHPATHKVLANGWRYEGDAPTLAALLRGAGYRTGGFVSGVPVNAASGLDAGFDVYADTATGHRSPLARLPGERTTARALEWLARDAATSFFLFVHYFDTHHPYEIPTDVPRPFAVDDHVRRTVAARGLVGLEPSDVLHRPLELNGVPIDVAAGLNAYDNLIRRVDAQVGVLVAALRRHGVLDDTLVVVTSDHGEGLGEHGYWSHGLHLYEEQLHVPLIVRPPRREAWKPARITHTVSLLDVLPTVAGFTPITAPASSAGRPLGPTADGPRWLVAQRRRFPADVRSRRGRFAATTTLHALRGDGRFKYLRAGDGREELYDLARDPHERDDLSERRGEEVVRLRGLLDRRLGRVATGAPVTAPPMDPSVQRKLRALGYL